MASLDNTYLTLLKKTLETDFVAHLPVLLKDESEERKRQKNLSRAFSAFALAHLCNLAPAKAAAFVVDDFDDYGVDAIYYDAGTDTLFLIQAKLKASEQFKEAEALAFCQGARKIVAQDLSGFNANVQARQIEIEDAVSNCSAIQLVVAHTGSGISGPARTALDALLADETHGEDRFAPSIIDYNAERTKADLQAEKAHPRVDARIILKPYSSQTDGRMTYFGFIELQELAKLYKENGVALFDKNLRNPIGHLTEVAKAVQGTLATRPEDFVYLNNGVTALCERIDPKQNKKSGKHLNLQGISVINGAQTIAAAAHFMNENPEKDISKAGVLLTLIKSDGDKEFSKSVTRARNHQNPVTLVNFAALDDEQERLRRDLATLDYHYAYKAEDLGGGPNPKLIRIEEAAHALALMQVDPRFPIWLKKEPGQLLDTDREPYKALFTANLTPFELINAVLFYRYVQRRMIDEAKAAGGRERITYKHCGYALGFVLAKRLTNGAKASVIFNDAQLKEGLSPHIDALRQSLWTVFQAKAGGKGPLAVFRNQTEAVPIIRDTMIAHYALETDPVVAEKQKKFVSGQGYQEDLFKYLASKAPQIGNPT